MLRITIEMIPGGDESKKHTMQVMTIRNDGTGTEVFGNYVGYLKAEYGERTGRVIKFNRQTMSVWSLVGSFLKLFGHTKHSPSMMIKFGDRT